MSSRLRDAVETRESRVRTCTRARAVAVLEAIEDEVGGGTMDERMARTGEKKRDAKWRKRQRKKRR